MCMCHTSRSFHCVIKDEEHVARGQREGSDYSMLGSMTTRMPKLCSILIAARGEQRKQTKMKQRLDNMRSLIIHVKIAIDIKTKRLGSDRPTSTPSWHLSSPTSPQVLHRPPTHRHRHFSPSMRPSKEISSHSLYISRKMTPANRSTSRLLARTSLCA